MAAPPLGLARRVAAPAPVHSSSCSRHLRPRLLPSRRWSGVVRMGVAMRDGQGGEEEETRQAKEMAAARRRWETLIREQKIKTLTPREAGYTFKLTDKVLLDVRPSNERQKAWVKGSTWIPIFDVDTSSDLSGLGKKFTSFVMGGWWSGSSTMSFNKNFVQQVEEKFSKDTDIILVCQKGLRSIAASEQLYNAGFENLFWVQGGLEAADEEDYEREGPQPFKLAGIGGVSEFFGAPFTLHDEFSILEGIRCNSAGIVGFGTLRYRVKNVIKQLKCHDWHGQFLLNEVLKKSLMIYPTRLVSLAFPSKIRQGAGLVPPSNEADSFVTPQRNYSGVV